MPLIVRVILVLAIVAVAGFILSYVVVNLIMYNKFFKRQSAEAMRKGALTDAYYDKYRDEIITAAKRMEELPFKRVSCLSVDGLTLSARYYYNTGKKIVVFCHGVHTLPWNNFGVIGDDFWNAGYDILLIDERAHWQSEGKFITYGSYEGDDILCWVKYLKQFEVERIVLYGISMGATSIALISDKIEDERVKAMVLDCGFTSLFDLERHITDRNHIPFWLTSGAFSMGTFFGKLRPKEKTQNHLSKTHIPALFLHGRTDSVVPHEHSVLSYEACASKKELIIVENAGHTVASVCGGDETRKKILKFTGG